MHAPGYAAAHFSSMCNRFRSIKEWSDIPCRFHSGPRLNFEFNPNVAPTELVPVLVTGQGVVLARFGINRLGSADKPRPPLLNVRTDGLRKGQFRKHLKERRCVIPCEGFYEWRDEGGKQPYYFNRKDGKPLMLAGIWEIAEYKGDSRVAFAILTDSGEMQRHGLGVRGRHDLAGCDATLRTGRAEQVGPVVALVVRRGAVFLALHALWRQ